MARPRSFDRDAALACALEAFWRHGYDQTSINDLTEAMGIKPPSLYAAFGDKQALYLASLEHFRTHMAVLYEQAIRAEPTVRGRVLAFLRLAIDRYTSGDAARGCMAVCTATADATTEPRIREALAAIVRELDEAYAASLRIARDRGELPATADITTLAQMLAATQQTLAVRARAGVPKPALERIARAAVDLVFDQRSSETKSRRRTSKRAARSH
jgi:AcrR family transcriptional regulator